MTLVLLLSGIYILLRANRRVLQSQMFLLVAWTFTLDGFFFFFIYYSYLFYLTTLTTRMMLT